MPQSARSHTVQSSQQPSWELLRGSIVVASLVFVFLTIFRKRQRARSGNIAAAIGLIFPVFRRILVAALAVELIEVILLAIYGRSLPIGLAALIWSSSRFVTDGLAVFYLQNGVGYHSIRRSSFIAISWAVFSFTVWLVIPALWRSDRERLADGLYYSYLGSLLLAYLALTAAPLRLIPRRAAIFPLALLMSILLATQFLKEALQASSSSIAWNIFALILWFVYPWVIYESLIIDSKHWQGLQTRSWLSPWVTRQANLNEPLLGLWGGLLESPAKALASIMEFEASEEVRIIPFGTIHLRTDVKFRSGSNSRVYMADYLQQRVAVKMLFAIELDAEAIRDFYEEVQVLSRLKHPNIIPLLGIAIMPPALSMVLEWATHGALFEFLSKYQSYPQLLSQLTRARLMLDCVTGLEHVHESGFVHSDIKSLNYLVTDGPQYGLTVKLTDVGDCRPIASEPAEGGSVRPKTLNWASPEVLAGLAYRYLPPQDVYSLALVFYEILTLKQPYNREPFKSMSIRQFINEVVRNGTRPRLTDYAVHPELQTMIMRCWSASPSERLPTSSVHKEVKRYVSYLETTAERESENLLAVPKSNHLWSQLPPDSAPP